MLVRQIQLALPTQCSFLNNFQLNHCIAAESGIVLDSQRLTLVSPRSEAPPVSFVLCLSGKYNWLYQLNALSKELHCVTRFHLVITVLISPGEPLASYQDPVK